MFSFNNRIGLVLAAMVGVALGAVTGATMMIALLLVKRRLNFVIPVNPRRNVFAMRHTSCRLFLNAILRFTCQLFIHLFEC